MKIINSSGIRWLIESWLLIALLTTLLSAPAPVSAAASTARLPIVPPIALAADQRTGATVDATVALSSTAPTELEAAYWTAARMQNAQPLSMELALPDGQLLSAGAVPLGEPGWAPSRPPDGWNLPLVAENPPLAQQLAPPGTTDFVGPGYVSQFPYTAIGKIYFTMAGVDYTCSGAAIGENAVWTAGHCLSNGNATFHANWIFVPAYDSGVTPFPGPWTAAYMIVPASFHYRLAWADYGVAILNPMGGRTVRQTVGALGFAWNLPPQQPALAVGYPTPFYGGGRQVHTYADVTLTDSAFDPPTIGIISKLKSGASGGPWLRNVAVDAVGEVNLLNGDTSYQKAGTPQVYSPQMGDVAKRLWDCAQNSTPTVLNCVGIDQVLVDAQVSSALVEPGAMVTYTVTLHNRGAQPATNVAFIDRLPKAATFVSAQLPGGACSTATPDSNEPGVVWVTCSLGALPAGGAVAAIIAATAPTAAATLLNRVDVRALSEHVSNKNLDLTTLVHETDLALTPTTSSAGTVSRMANSTVVPPGAQFQQLLSLHNRGPLPATNVVVSAILPAELAFVSASLPGGACGVAGGVVTCTQGVLANGAVVTALITVTAPSHAAILTTTVSARADQIDAFPANNLDLPATTAVHAADLALTQVASRLVAAPGVPVTYHLAIQNRGPQDAFNLALIDLLPDGATFVSAELPGSVCNAVGGGVTCALGALTAGETVTATLALRSPNAGVVFTNTASVTADQADAYPANNLAIQIATALDGACQARIDDDLTTPYYSVQEAIDAAQPGATVKVAGFCASGFALPAPASMHTTVGVVRQIAYIRKSLTLQGGYTAANWLTADPAANPTTLDGRYEQGGNNRGLLIAGPDTGERITVTVAGLNLVNGIAAQDSTGAAGGGGYVTGARLIFRDNGVYSNTALYRGGGLYIEASAEALLESNTFAWNRAQASNLGGYYFGSNDGGGLALVASHNATLRNNTFDRNAATYLPALLNGNNGGGLALLDSANASLRDNTFTGNAATVNGGALYLAESADATLVNTVIGSNRVMSGTGGVYVYASAVNLFHTTLAQNGGGDGSGVVVGGSGRVALTNTIVASQTVGLRVSGDSAAALYNVLWFGAPITVSAAAGATVNTQHETTGAPIFDDAANDDYHLGQDSAALNRGLDAGVPADRDGYPRDRWPDLGAYESRVGQMPHLYLPVVMQSEFDESRKRFTLHP